MIRNFMSEQKLMIKDSKRVTSVKINSVNKTISVHFQDFFLLNAPLPLFTYKFKNNNILII